MNLKFLKSKWYNLFVLCMFFFVLLPIYVSSYENGFEMKPFVISFLLVLPQLIMSIIYFFKRIHIRITSDF